MYCPFFAANLRGALCNSHLCCADVQNFGPFRCVALQSTGLRDARVLTGAIRPTLLDLEICQHLSLYASGLVHNFTAALGRVVI